MVQPYVGVTGIVTPDDVETVAHACKVCPPDYQLMAGVLMSGKTLRGMAVPNRRYPSREQARELLVQLHVVGAWPVVHYNVGGRKEPLDEQLGELVASVPGVRGLQLNVIRPDNDAVMRFVRAHPQLPLILQVNKSSPTSTAPHAVRNYILAHRNWATYTLLDLSGGRGVGLEAEWATRVLNGWSAEDPAPAVAGGLGPECEAVLRAVRAGARGQSVSCDAEGALRVPVPDPLPNERYQDQLDRGKVLQYVRAAALALG